MEFLFHLSTTRKALISPGLFSIARWFGAYRAHWSERSAVSVSCRGLLAVPGQQSSQGMITWEIWSWLVPLLATSSNSRSSSGAYSTRFTHMLIMLSARVGRTLPQFHNNSPYQNISDHFSGSNYTAYIPLLESFLTARSGVGKNHQIFCIRNKHTFVSKEIISAKFRQEIWLATPENDDI